MDMEQKLHYRNLCGMLIRREDGLLEWRCPDCKEEGTSKHVLKRCPSCSSGETDSEKFNRALRAIQDGATGSERMRCIAMMAKAAKRLDRARKG